MIIHVKNKNTLIIDDFKLKCCIGKNGLNSNKIEGDYSTPKGIFNLKLSAQEFNKLGTGYIFNSIGELVREINLKSSNNILINLKENSPGIYYLKFEKKPYISHKIIILD